MFKLGLLCQERTDDPKTLFQKLISTYLTKKNMFLDILTVSNWDINSNTSSLKFTRLHCLRGGNGLFGYTEGYNSNLLSLT